MLPNASNVVVFDYTAWAARYPELSAWVGQPQATAFFFEAQLYCDNTPCGIVPNCAPVYQRQQFLQMLTAHIAALNASLNNQPPNPLVGRIGTATEGTVNVTVNMDLPAGSPQWFAQTKYGIAFWQASSSFRTMHYVPGGRNAYNPYGFPNIVAAPR